MYSHIRTAWASALRSGRFVQTRFDERRVEGEGRSKRYCAFGVLVKVAEDSLRQSLTCPLLDDDTREAMITKEAWAAFETWAGTEGLRHLRGEDGALLARVLAANDRGEPFDVIAKMVEV